MAALTGGRVLLVVIATLAGGCGGYGSGTDDPPGDLDGASVEVAGTALRVRRDAVRDLLGDVARPAVARGTRAELRGAYEGCRADALDRGYRTWTYAAGGRLEGRVTLDVLERALRRAGASDVARAAGELSARRDGVEVVITRHRGALVVAARAAPCVDVPLGQEAVWLDREPQPRIPVGHLR